VQRAVHSPNDQEREAGAFAARLRTCRYAAGLSQQELAERSGLSVRTIGNLEAGRARYPYRNSICCLADALGLTASARDDFIAAADRRPLAGVRSAALDESVHHDGAGPVVPRQLPSAVKHFVGRDEELAALTVLLEQAKKSAAPTLVISAITGTAGVGKTALAVHWAHQHIEEFPDGQLYVNLRGFDPSGTPLQPVTAVRQFLDALPVPQARVPAGSDAQIGLFRSLLADKRMLIVLDNVRDAEQVRPLLPGTAGCMALITSRSQLTDLIALDGAIPVAVGLLTRDGARGLLASRLGVRRVDHEHAAAEELIDLCARLPLALNIAASYAATSPGTSLDLLTADLGDTHRRLDLLSMGTGAASLRAVFSWSYRALAQSAARMFRLLGAHPGPDISVAAAASLAAVDRGEARAALVELTAAHLLTEHVPGRYSLHDLLRAYADEQESTDDGQQERRAALGRVLDHYLHSARMATLLLYPARDLGVRPSAFPGAAPEHFDDDQQAMAWFDSERQVLLAVTALAAQERFDMHAWRMASVLAAYLERGGHWQDYVVIQTVALGAAEYAGDLAGQANACLLLGRACSRTGARSIARAHLRRALELYQSLGDRAGQAHAHHSLGWMLGHQCHYRAALQHARQALSLYLAAGHRTGQARALNTVGWYSSLLGAPEQALTYCQQALELHRELGNHDGEADAWDSLAHAHQSLGHVDDAIACYQQALRLFRKLGDRYQQADTLSRLGDTCHVAGRTRQAHDAWRRALRILSGLQHPDTEHVRSKLAALQTHSDSVTVSAAGLD
jgi:tetratricopeptide (TPR) repeat protein/transcriptional regulator with XRE-family HTH domain